MHRKILTVARKLEKASKAHAGQAKLLKSLASHGKKKQKAEVKYAPRVKPGLGVRLTPIQVLTLIWPHLSTARTQTMQKKQRVVNAKEDNGTTQTMERAELGTHRD